MQKISDALTETTAGRRILRGAGVFQLLALVAMLAVCELPVEMIVQMLATSISALALADLKKISRHRARLAVRIAEVLPVVQRAAALAFDLLQPVARVFAAPARARPRPAASRLGRIPAVTLAPRLLPIPFIARA